MRDLARRMEERLPERATDMLRSSGELAARRGQSVFAVGGFVRDLLLGRENLDIDLVVEGDGIAFARALAAGLGGTCKAFDRFGTAAVYFKDRSKIDVATARVESYRRPAALPDVKCSSLREDLYRRDFTINSLAVMLNPGGYGRLIDFFGGQEDLKRGIVRALHRGSFIDDPTRALRAIRFAHRYRFRISGMTGRLIQDAIRDKLFDRLSGKRIFAEIRLLLMEERPVKVLGLMERYGLLTVIHKGLGMGAEGRIQLRRLERAIDWLAVNLPVENFYRWLAYFVVLLGPLSEGELKRVRERLDIGGKREREVLDKRAAAHSGLKRLRLMRRPKMSDIYRALEGLPLELLLYLMGRADTRPLRSRISHYILHLRHVRLSVTGRELIGLGLVPGPQYGEILHRLLLARVDGRVRDREEEIEFVRYNYLRG